MSRTRATDHFANDVTRALSTPRTPPVPPSEAEWASILTAITDLRTDMEIGFSRVNKQIDIILISTQGKETGHAA
jgi:hypothetical protein